jgi:hypothetical protein
MANADPIYMVDLEPDERLGLRERPTLDAGLLAELSPGQLVARLDDEVRGGWWQLFADTPGDGAFVGYALARHLSPWTDRLADAPASPQPAEDAPEDAPEDLVDVEPEAPAPTPSPPAPFEPSPPPRPAFWPDPPGGLTAPGWSALARPEHRHDSGCCDALDGRTVNRVVIHISGGNELAAAHDVYMSQVAPHYLIDRNGDIHQYVQEKDRAWHAGIKSWERKVYDRGDGSWRRYRSHLSWASYPANAVYVRDDGITVVDKSSPEARLVTRADGSEWPEYALFDARWGRAQNVPIGYEDERDANLKSVGIEILSTGSDRASSEHYTEAMYLSLARLVTDICDRYGLPRTKGVVVGHEDVNPIARWMWDPNQGFDWSRVWASADV